MNKIVFAVLLCFPFVSFATPSVRVLGNQNAVAKTVPVVRSANVNKTASQTVPVRIGTTQKNKTTGVTGVISEASGTRFPVIATGKAYNSVSQPSSVGYSNNGTVDSIVKAVTEQVKDNYYTKEEIDYKIGLLQSNFDDPRFDAIRTVNPNNKRGALNSDEYIYIWIEQ